MINFNNKKFSNNFSSLNTLQKFPIITLTSAKKYNIKAHENITKKKVEQK